MKRLSIIIMVLLLIGCAKVEKYSSIQDKLSKMTSYRTDAEITYINNNQSTTYTSSIAAKSDGKYRIDISSPKEYTGNVLMYDGKLVWHYNPNIADKKITASPPDKASRREIILFSFLKNYANSMETTTAVANIDNNETVELCAELPDDNIFGKEKLFVTKVGMLPVKLVIFDKENNERVVVKFSNFDYNSKIEDNEFVISS